MKKRLIDANALKEKAFAETESGEGVVYVQDIDEAPTVDAVEVVRCKDCNYGKLDDAAWCHDVYGNENDTTLYHCLYGFGHNKCDHFCSYGERKGDGN